MDLNKLKEYLGEDWDRTEELINRSVSSDIDLLDRTNKQILTHSGKQLRPLLSLLIARACAGGSNLGKSSYIYAAASELLHNATLLHDDVADNSDRRRGVPTIRAMMGPSVSVLIGDFWLVRAMEIILDADGGDRVIKMFSKTLSNLAEGELLQLQKAQAGDTDEKDYYKIIYNKTASLFEAAAMSAAVSVGAPAEYEEAVRTYAARLGLAFQIRDDIFDYSPQFKTGKPAGVDILEQKITLPLLKAFADCNDKAREADIRKSIVNISSDPEGIRAGILEFVREHRGIDAAEEELRELIDRALKALEPMPEGREKEYLKELAHFVGLRKS